MEMQTELLVLNVYFNFCSTYTQNLKNVKDRIFL